MRGILAGLIVGSLLVSSAFAAPISGSPLPAGQPAGVKQAAIAGPNIVLVLLSAGIAIGGIALAVSGGNKNSVTSPTTTTVRTTALP